MPSVSAHVAITLASHLDNVFGVMGNGNAYFLNALERQTDVRYTPVRHEAGAVVAEGGLGQRGTALRFGDQSLQCVGIEGSGEQAQ